MLLSTLMLLPLAAAIVLGACATMQTNPARARVRPTRRD